MKGCESLPSLSLCLTRSQPNENCRSSDTTITPVSLPDGLLPFDTGPKGSRTSPIVLLPSILRFPDVYVCMCVRTHACVSFTFGPSESRSSKTSMLSLRHLATEIAGCHFAPAIRTRAKPALRNRPRLLPILIFSAGVKHDRSINHVAALRRNAVAGHFS